MRPMFITVERTGDGVRMIDQRLLPTEETYLTFETPEQVADAIRNMVVRGAPAIGVSAAFGLALGATRAAANEPERFRARMDELFKLFASARPTAVNLFWAIDRVRDLLDDCAGRELDSAATALRPFSRTVTPAAWRPPGTAPPSGSFAGRWQPGARCGYWPTRPGRFSRARDSPPGN